MREWREDILARSGERSAALRPDDIIGISATTRLRGGCRTGGSTADTFAMRRPAARTCLTRSRQPRRQVAADRGRFEQLVNLLVQQLF